MAPSEGANPWHFGKGQNSCQDARDFLVELRGFERPTSFPSAGARHHRAPRFGFQRRRALSRGYFHGPTRLKLLEALTCIEEHRFFTRSSLVTTHDHIDLDVIFQEVVHSV
jgi:hypothetical protein